MSWACTTTKYLMKSLKPLADMRKKCFMDCWNRWTKDTVSLVREIGIRSLSQISSAILSLSLFRLLLRLLSALFLTLAPTPSLLVSPLILSIFNTHPRTHTMLSILLFLSLVASKSFDTKIIKTLRDSLLLTSFLKGFHCLLTYKAHFSAHYISFLFTSASSIFFILFKRSLLGLTFFCSCSNTSNTKRYHLQIHNSSCIPLRLCSFS